MRLRAAPIAVALLLLGACAAREEAAPSAAGLRDHDWTITTIDGAPVATDGQAPTLRFTADGVSGTTGVNSYGGTATLADTTLAIGPLRTTRMAGPEPLMHQETAFTRALAETRHWSLAAGALVLRDADGAERLRAK